MSVFEFEGQAEEDNQGQNREQRSQDPNVKTVAVLESKNGDNSTRHRATIPADFSRDMNLEGGETLLMEHVEGSDEIRVKRP